VLGNARGQEAIETLLIVVAGLAVLSLTVGWGYSRYAVATSTMYLESAQHTGEKVFAGIVRATVRGEANEYRFKPVLARGAVLRLETNATDLRVDYVRGGTSYTVLRRRFPIAVGGSARADVAQGQVVAVRVQGGAVALACVTEGGEPCPAA
jgi:hypothetical protein